MPLKRQATSHEPDHVAMISHPDQWPCWPFLPLKRNGGRETAFMIEGSDTPRFRVFTGNMFNPDYTNFKDYDSAIAIVGDGWQVD